MASKIRLRVHNTSLKSKKQKDSQKITLESLRARKIEPKKGKKR